jgi:DNA-binding response OmpR family regulator
MTATTAEQKNIVVCDDNDDILAFLYSLLSNSGFGVTMVHGFGELKEALKTVKPDLFILDVFMPECDGFWIAEELQSQGYQVPIIFMTAFDDPAVRLNAPVSGAVEYFVKPVEPDVLLAKIQKALGVKPSVSNWNLKVTEGSFDENI